MSAADFTNDDREFAIRAAEYLRHEGLTDEEVRGALVTEFGLQSPEADELASLATAA